MRKPIKTRKHRARKNRVRKHKVRKHKTRKHRVRKHKTRKHRVRKHKTRKHKTRKHRVRKHRVRKHKGGGEGQPQESLSDCALTCQKYKVGDEIIYTYYRLMGYPPRVIQGTIEEIRKPSRGRNMGDCCYILQGYDVSTGAQVTVPVPCELETAIRRPGEDVQEPVRRRGPGRRNPDPPNVGLNQGINPQQSSGQI